MRAFRDSLSRGALVGALAGLVGACNAAGDAPRAPPVGTATMPAVTAAAAPATAADNPYFPLTVGNRWTYRCSAEGEYQFDKTLQIVSVAAQGKTTYFRAELRAGKDGKPLVSYLRAAPNGDVFSSLAPQNTGAELLISANPKVGDMLGMWTVAATESLRTPALPKAQALRVENFSTDDLTLDDDKRAQWQARYYARGVGPVADANGAGGECSLSKFTVKK